MVEEVKLPTYETLLTEAIRSLAVDSGIVSSPVSAGGNSLSDTTKAWAINVHKTRLVKIIRGEGVGQLAVLDGNASNSLVIRGTWPQAIGAGAVYVILEKDIAQILRDVFGGGSDISAANPLEVHDSATEGATGIFHEQADTAINESVDNTEHFVVALTADNTRYILKNLRLKSGDPGVGETITVKLYELIKDVETEVDSFVIDHDNYGTAHSLADMFGLPQIAGDSIRVSLTGSAAGPVVVEGQMSHAKTNV